MSRILTGQGRSGAAEEDNSQKGGEETKVENGVEGPQAAHGPEAAGQAEEAQREHQQASHGQEEEEDEDVIEAGKSYPWILAEREGGKKINQKFSTVNVSIFYDLLLYQTN